MRHQRHRAPPIAACLEQAKEFGGSDGRCTLIGGGKANVVYAAQYNTALVRYIDFMDSYLDGEEICHPSDNIGSVLATCEHAGRSGKEFLTAWRLPTKSSPYLPPTFHSQWTGLTLQHSSRSR